MVLCGTAGSTALSNVAGTIADLFGDRDIASQAMALFVCSVPPWGVLLVLGLLPMITWNGDGSTTSSKVYGLSKDTVLTVSSIIIGGVFAIVLCFMPETLPRLVIAKAVKKRVADDSEAQIAEAKVSVVNELKFVATMTVRIMFIQPIVVLLGLYNGFAYGLLFLYLDAVHDVFAVNNNLSVISADLSEYYSAVSHDAS